MMSASKYARLNQDIKPYNIAKVQEPTILSANLPTMLNGLILIRNYA